MQSPRERSAESGGDRRASVEAALLRAMRELLEEGEAFHSLSVEQIATRAGIGRTAFYFYFRDKRELLMQLTGGVVDDLYAEADRWWHGSDDPAAQLGRTLSHVVALYLENAALLRVVVEVAGYDDAVRAFWHGLVGRFVEATRDRIERDRSAGRAAATPSAGELASALVWMCERAVYQFAVERPAEDPTELTEALGQVLVRGIYGRLPEDGVSFDPPGRSVG